MKPFYVNLSIYSDEERYLIEREIFDRAVANGATAHEGRAGSESAIELVDYYTFFGVHEDGCTAFSNYISIFDDKELTIEEVRKLYPLLTEITKEETMKPKDLVCFVEVAKVIGEENATIELQKVIDSSIDIDKSYELPSAFVWEYSPQGTDFWSTIDRSKNPYPKQEYNMVKQPPHYLLFPEHDLEVKDINKRLLDRIDDSSMDISSYEAGWLQQSLQYLIRCYAKNQWEDIEKAHETLGFVIESYKSRKGDVK